MNRRILNAWGKFRYKQVKMEPHMNCFILTAFLFSICAELVNNEFLKFILFVLYMILFILIWSNFHVNTKKINDFLMLTRHPIKPNEFCIYQNVDEKKLKNCSCQDLRELYFSEMPQVFCLLKPGTYRMVTQPLFTKELLRAENVQVIRQKKAYKKKTRKLQEEIFLNRCRNCSKTICPYRASKAEKQFYYVEFKVLKGCVTSGDESFCDKHNK